MTSNELIQLWVVLRTDLGSLEVPPVLVLKTPTLLEWLLFTSSKSKIIGHLPSEIFLIKIPSAIFADIASEKLHGFKFKFEYRELACQLNKFANFNTKNFEN